MPKAGVAAALGENTPDGHGLRLWRALAKELDPAREGNFIAEFMALMAHSPVELKKLPEVIPAWEARVAAPREKYPHEEFTEVQRVGALIG